MSGPQVSNERGQGRRRARSLLRNGLLTFIAIGVLQNSLCGQAKKAEEPAKPAAPARAPAAAEPTEKQTGEQHPKDRNRLDRWNTNGFAVPFDRKVTDRFNELNGYLEQGAWSKAFRLLADLEDNAWSGMLPDQDGFLIPAGIRLSQTLLNLPPEGRAAFRIFFEPTARRLLDSLKSAGASKGEDVRIAEAVFRRYFLTDSGDEAADLLGDAYFQQGEFLKADRCWRSILENHPDTSISETRLLVKRGLCLIRAGQSDRLAQVFETLKLRFPGEKVTLGGASVDALEYLEALASKSGLPVGNSPVESAAAPASPAVDLPGLTAPGDEAKPIWQYRFREALKEQEQSKTTQTRNLGARVVIRQVGRAFAVDSNTVRNTLTSLVPSSDSDGRRAYLTWLGACCAVDLESGKEIWRSQDFQLAAQRVLGNNDQIVYSNSLSSPHPFPIVVSDGVVVAIKETTPGAQIFQGEMQAQSISTAVAYDAETGNVRWKSEAVPALRDTSILGIPVIRAGEVFVVTQKPDNAEWVLRVIDLRNGNEHWSVKLGTAQLIGDERYGFQMTPTPTLRYSGNSLHILTNNGALLCVNLSERELEWVYKFETAGAGEDNRMMAQFIFNNGPSLKGTTGTLMERDGVLYFKEGANRMLYALDPLNRSMHWSRPVTATSKIVALDDEQIYLLADDLMAINRKSRALLWSIRLPTTTADHVLLGKETVLVPTSRGIYELSRQKGDRIRIFRGDDVALVSGELSILKDKLLCVSSQGITAYGVGRTKENTNSPEQKADVPANKTK